ncbi:MAG: hypothetical protein ACLP0J_03445 [Solirubrobacteraceae bacterium]|jgi:hypothetical protein
MHARSLTFEDFVGSWIAAGLLAGRTVLDGDLGAPTRIDFQVEADGCKLDDLLITFGDARCCCSVKSNRQIDRRRPSADFVERAWAEVLGASGSSFDPAVDLPGMVTAPVDNLV